MIPRRAGLLVLLLLGCTTYDFDRATQELANATPAQLRGCLGAPDALIVRGQRELLQYSRQIGRAGVVEFDPVAGARISERGSRRICEYSFRFGPNGFEGLAVRGRTASGLRDDQR